MSVFFEKKEADLSGKKNSSSRSNGRKAVSTDRKGKGKEKVNGNHAEVKADESSDGVGIESEDKEGTPEA